jgi:hypothetical protein
MAGLTRCWGGASLRLPRAGTADQEGGDTVSVGVPDDPAAGAPDPAAAATIARLRAEIVARDAIIATLEARISRLDAHVVELEARLRANSSNSSKPPSADGLAKGPPKPNRAARRAAARRKPGGQPGAPGAHLAQVEHPDVVVVHAPSAASAAAASWPTPRWWASRPGRSTTCHSLACWSPSIGPSGAAVAVRW